ncbi:MAG: hypothetical protein QG670_1990 [Thermoproteota archaeon]|nr:hypothetical protein [Thermoproteota archaeon]
MQMSVFNVASFGNERSLHSAIKTWIAKPGDRFEVTVDGFIVDVVRDDLLIEVQTRNFSAIRDKISTLVLKHRVRLVYPIPSRKTIVHVDRLNGNPLKRRVSPKKGRLIELFNELVWIPQLCKEQNFELEVLMVEEEEIRCDDGRGTWRRRGISIKNHILVRVVDQAIFTSAHDFFSFLPDTLSQPFTNQQIAISLGISLRLARRMTYSLREMGALHLMGKAGHALLFRVSE